MALGCGWSQNPDGWGQDRDGAFLDVEGPLRGLALLGVGRSKGWPRTRGGIWRGGVSDLPGGESVMGRDLGRGRDPGRGGASGGRGLVWAGPRVGAVNQPLAPLQQVREKWHLVEDLSRLLPEPGLCDSLGPESPHSRSSRPGSFCPGFPCPGSPGPRPPRPGSSLADPACRFRFPSGSDQ